MLIRIQRDHLPIYLRQFGFVVCRQAGANLLSTSLASLLHLDLPVFLDQRVPAQPHLLLQLHIIVLPSCLRSESLAGNHRTMKIFREEIITPIIHSHASVVHFPLSCTVCSKKEKKEKKEIIYIDIYKYNHKKLHLITF